MCQPPRHPLPGAGALLLNPTTVSRCHRPATGARGPTAVLRITGQASTNPGATHSLPILTEALQPFSPSARPAVTAAPEVGVLCSPGAAPIRAASPGPQVTQRWTPICQLCAPSPPRRSTPLQEQQPRLEAWSRGKLEEYGAGGVELGGWG